jgi:hypothetical protein
VTSQLSASRTYAEDNVSGSQIIAALSESLVTSDTLQPTYELLTRAAK